MPPSLNDLPVATLGPEGTDAHAEATRLGADVTLCSSFPNAMAMAEAGGGHALVAAGYLDMHEQDQPTWVDLHFAYRQRLHLEAIWESPTKEMCVAVHRARPLALEDVRSLALHASTRSLVTEHFADDVRRDYVRAKPLAVDRLLDREVDACVGSVDVVRAHDELEVVDRFTPSMVWCLYAGGSA